MIYCFGTNSVNRKSLVYNYIKNKKSNLKLGGYIMKSLLAILMVALISTAVNANPGSKGDYVVTNDGKLIAAKVHLGAFKVHVKSDDGCLFEVKYKDVKSYKKGGDVYIKMPLYNEKQFSGMVFMKKINWRNGLGLYCYEDPSISGSENKRYFIYKDEATLWLEVDSKSAENIQNFYNRM